ncbi:hypothetical protein, partial [Acidisphaera rubrifaciens]|uniref:hypothetical protein n=1 Tax=Acidisphaera rubrifaciens TaxID=50715 RepID=UPI000662045E
MTDPDTYFRQAAAAAYAGQLTPAFQSALAARFADVAETDCEFVHTVDLGGGRNIDGALDLRGIEDAQLG